ncbi:hypothetical protein [Desulfuromonas sp. DDH964]|uniref:hypothetical protein n=1 Tax=Desulfuromonas sp. DDH964 TaxID=1823759 RepID=UPI00078EB02B|nr:hypothetical protein [Desulfuromonas sp. DDH964]AMV73752.1 hypothetical protein DBW_3454 [Desulfuromonas sp. DDH964]
MNSPPARRAFPLALLALLTALSLPACLGSRPSGSAGLAPFTSDGCSLFPDGTFTERDKWCDCCQDHDLAYWQGGSADDRDRADATLRDCVLARTNDPQLAETMYLGARVGGHPAFPTWYRWGYGWSYGRGYQPLSDPEKRQVQRGLAAYVHQHPTGYCAEKHPDP